MRWQCETLTGASPIGAMYRCDRHSAAEVHGQRVCEMHARAFEDLDVPVAWLSME